MLIAPIIASPVENGFANRITFSVIIFSPVEVSATKWSRAFSLFGSKPGVGSFLRS